jgi:uncharacterized membrane protein YsdA (DUF1294 family)/cold shock CspA family protein
MVQHTSARHGGVVTTWNDDRGFGFLKPDDGSHDIFLHFTAVPRGAARPYKGQHLTYELETDEKGKVRAVRAEPVVVTERAEPQPAPASSVIGIVAIAAFVAIFLVTRWRWGTPYTVAGLYLALSILAFAMYYADKRAAQRNRWRTPENTLLLVGLIGGWPGAVVAQQSLRHKTKKLSFRARFWTSVGINVVVFVLLAWYFSGHAVPGLKLL